MSQNQLNNLGIISIEHEEAKKVNYDAIIEEFAELKSRKFFC